MLPVMFMMLVMVTVCGISAMLIFRPPQTDALVELRALPLYPGASSVNYSGNTLSHQIGVKSWVTKSGGSIRSDRRRKLNITKASVTFDTGDEPGRVMEFYNVQIPIRGYSAVGTKPPSYRYLRWVAPFKIISDDFSELILGDELGYPITFYEVNVTAVEAQIDYDAKSRITQVTVEYIVFSESHELK